MGSADVRHRVVRKAPKVSIAATHCGLTATGSFCPRPRVHAMLFAAHPSTGSTEQFPLEEKSTKNFRQEALRDGGPRLKKLPCRAIETPPAPLGQGIANSVGLCHGRKKSSARNTARRRDALYYVIAGDGCLMEASATEAIAPCRPSQAKQADRNVGQHTTSLSDVSCIAVRQGRSGLRVSKPEWHAGSRIDGHNPALKSTPPLTEPQQNPICPTMIACKTAYRR